MKHGEGVYNRYSLVIDVYNSFWGGFEFKVKFKVNTVGVGPHRLGGRHIAAAPKNPRALLLRAAARGLYFRDSSYCRKIPPLRGALQSGYNPRKNTRGFPPLPPA